MVYMGRGCVKKAAVQVVGMETLVAAWTVKIGD